VAGNLALETLRVPNGWDVQATPQLSHSSDAIGGGIVMAGESAHPSGIGASRPGIPAAPGLLPAVAARGRRPIAHQAGRRTAPSKRLLPTKGGTIEDDDVSDRHQAEPSAPSWPAAAGTLLAPAEQLACRGAEGCDPLPVRFDVDPGTFHDLAAVDGDRRQRAVGVIHPDVGSRPRTSDTAPTLRSNEITGVDILRISPAAVRWRVRR
jgi:hypothetical protein